VKKEIENEIVNEVLAALAPAQGPKQYHALPLLENCVAISLHEIEPKWLWGRGPLMT
jgi:hypothetical protein